MAFNAVTEFNKLKQSQVQARGATESANTKGTPKSTWADISSIATGFLRAVEPKVEQGFFDPIKLPEFQRTKSYQDARKAWLATWPLARFSLFEFQRGTLANEVYPLNEEFWTKGLRFAIARGGAGVVPAPATLIKESIVEAANEAGLPKVPGLTDITDFLKIGLVIAGAYVGYRILEG